jgi:hypothetical protein
MKSKKKYYVVMTMFLAVLITASWSIIGATQTITESSELLLKAQVNKETFVLGEPISVEFEISNKGEIPVKVHSGGVETGYLKIFIAGSDGEYKEYVGSGWGVKMGRMFNLAPGESHKYKQASILWHGRIDVSGLSEQAAKEKLKGKVTTEYAFPKPGVYFIKGVSHFSENSTPIESEPVQIVINEPIGDDLKVWNQFRGNREIAILMQKGDFDTGKDEEKAELISQVEQIIEKYPNSTYSGYLKQNLTKFKVSEAKRDEFYKNIKQPKKPE